MDPFRLCLVLGPMAVYFLLIGAINLSRRPFLVTGVRDAAALAMAVSGLVIVGPLELFVPQVAAIRFGAFVWLLLLGLYVLCVTLALLVLRPRLVIYNISMDQLRPILAELVPQLDAEARWAGDSLAMPGLGVQLHVAHLAVLRNVSLVSLGSAQNETGWRRLEEALGAALRRVEIGRNPYGYNLLLTGAVMLGVLVFFVARDPAGASRALFKMLNL